MTSKSELTVQRGGKSSDADDVVEEFQQYLKSSDTERMHLNSLTAITAKAVSELIATRQELEWYKEQSSALSRYLKEQKHDGIIAVITALSLRAAPPTPQGD